MALEKSKRPIYLIAQEINREWNKQTGGIHFSAEPYLSAMMSLDTMNDKYGLESARSIIIYFLSNAAQFRGEDARRLKSELKALVK